MLINCVVYAAGRRVRDLPLDEEHTWTQSDEDSFVWVALKDATPEELMRVQHQFGLHELAVEDSREGHHRPKIEEYGDSLFIVLHLVEPRDGELHVGEVDVFVGPHYIVSVRNRSEQDFLGVRARAESQPHLLRQGASFVAYALIDAVVDRYLPVLEALETELDEIEGRIFSGGSPRDNVQRLYQLKGKVADLRHAVVPLKEGLSKLSGNRAPAAAGKRRVLYRRPARGAGPRPRRPDPHLRLRSRRGMVGAHPRAAGRRPAHPSERSLRRPALVLPRPSAR
jgi:magnesium transporter